EQQQDKPNDVPSKRKDVPVASPSDSSVPSKSGNVPHAEKRCIDESTAEVIDVPVMNPSLPSHQAIRGEAEGNPARAQATTTDSEEVTSETLLVVLDLSGYLFKEWRDVGRNLKLDETELENIEADNRRKGQKELVYHMLLKWKRKHGMKATNKTLRDALKAANRKDLSDYLLNRDQCGTTSDIIVCCRNDQVFQYMMQGDI
ncbi:putative receptor-interacting serine/threonine-protein kinase 1, partial [Apostichopus japonicus]